MEDSPSSNVLLYHARRWCSAWLGFVILHVLCMALDWSLRDSTSNQQPMPGGLPEYLGWFVQVGSLLGLFVALMILMPFTWSTCTRVVLSAVQVVAGAIGMAFGWLYYVLVNGIDTL
jgi:hypothetical protein